MVYKLEEHWWRQESSSNSTGGQNNNKDDDCLTRDTTRSIQKYHWLTLKQRYLMALFYYSLGGPDWINSTPNFFLNPQKHECEWMGIVCNHKGNITATSFDANNLKGQIPNEIRKIQEMRSLIIKNNLLDGTIPDTISQLVKLEQLGLYNNNMFGDIPSSLGNLIQLTFLGLQYNYLTGFIPNEITQLSNLQQLQLQGNEISGSIPRRMDLMVSLTYLDLHDNNITDVFLSLWELSSRKHTRRNLGQPFFQIFGSQR